MRFSKRSKVFALIVLSFCFLSLWTTLWDPVPVTLVPMEAGVFRRPEGSDPFLARAPSKGLLQTARPEDGHSVMVTGSKVEPADTHGSMMGMGMRADSFINQVTRFHNKNINKDSSSSSPKNDDKGNAGDVINNNGNAVNDLKKDDNTIHYGINNNNSNSSDTHEIKSAPTNLPNYTGQNATKGSLSPNVATPAIMSSSSTPALNQTRAILVSYMRSGSTFMGDLFQASPEVMYLYEPLLYTNDVDELAKGTPIRARIIYKFIKDTNVPETLDYTTATLRCNLSASNLQYLVGYTYSRSFDDYATCVERRHSQANYRDVCSVNVTKRCQASRNVISKILRLKMWEVEELLTRDPELRIIHLVRDPRGITMSRRKARYFLNPKTLCSRMNKDANLSLALQKKYPGRILTIRYEDLATSPLNITRKLFDHAGVSWTQQIVDKVQDLTSSKNVSFQEKIHGTKRKNSAATAFNWRTLLPYQATIEIQSFCKEMMDLYGYIRFNSSREMTNLTLLSLKKDYSDSFYKANIFHLFGS